MKKLLLPIYILLSMAACTKEIGVTGPAGPQGPAGADGAGSGSDTGTIAGRLTLYDEFCFPQNNSAGVIVTLTSGTLQLKDTTNPAGQYSFPGLKTGTYDLSYSKTGYGTMKVFGVSHFGGGAAPTTVKNVYVLQFPQKTAPDSVTFTVNNGLYTYFLITLDTTGSQYSQYEGNLLLFVGKDKNVSYSHYTVEYNTLFSPTGQGGYLQILNKNNSGNPLPFKSGDTLYAVAYTYSRYLHLTTTAGYYFDPMDASCYIDPQTGLLVYPNISQPSSVLPFVY